jgi:sigma-70-like protein
MTPLDTLAPDQRAVLELVLRQGRSYGELSELLGIPERDVRGRADAGLRALAGEAADGVDTGRIADWLLGQQPEAEADRTRTAVARSAAAREWATTAAERLRAMGGAAVPDVPEPDEPPAQARRRPSGDSPTRRRPLRDDAAGEDAPVAARPRPLREDAPPRAAAASPPSSKLGGAILIGVLVLIVGGLIAFVLTRGDDNQPAAPAQASATPTPTATSAATGNDIVLQGTGSSKAAGLLRLIRGKDDKVRFAIAAQNVPANQGREVYAVWFTQAGGKPRRLGFAQAQVGSDGVLTTGGPQKGDEDQFPRWFATYDKILITRETDAKATKPGPAVLEGTLPGAG